MQQDEQLQLNAKFYDHIHLQKREPEWRGVRIIKMPTDLMLYAEVIQETKPKWIIEIGTKFGGSALYFQDMLDLAGGGRVVTIDIAPAVASLDPRITYLTGNSIDRAIIEQVRSLVGSDPVMVVLDGNHHRKQVKWELYHYGKIVTPGQYIVVEDCYTRDSRLYGPGQARDWYLQTRDGKRFEQTNLDRRYLVGVCLGGWLRCKA